MIPFVRLVVRGVGWRKHMLPRRYKGPLNHLQFCLLRCMERSAVRAMRELMFMERPPGADPEWNEWHLPASKYEDTP